MNIQEGVQETTEGVQETNDDDEVIRMTVIAVEESSTDSKNDKITCYSL